MSTALKERGVFWWFVEEHGNTASLETSVPGTLTITEEGRIDLQLEGSLWFENPDAGSPWDESRWLPAGKRITGQLDRSGDSHILLLSLLRTDFSLPDEKPARQSYEAALCFTNDFPFPANFDWDKFQALRIELDGLEEWLQLDSIYVDSESREEDHTEFKVSYKNHEFNYKTPMADISIENLILGGPSIFSNRPTAKLNIWQTNWLIYRPSKQSALGELRVAYKRIEEVIALLIGQYFRLDWPIFVSNDEFERWYKLYYSRGPKSEKLPYSFYLWTTLPILNGKFGDLLNLWQTNVERCGAGYELYIAALRSPLPYPEHQFVNLVWAIESLHRSWQRESEESDRIVDRKMKTQEVLKRFAEPADKQLRQWLKGKLRYAYEPTLEERIREAFSRLPLNIDENQLTEFAKRCAKRRNDISHEGGRQPGENSENFLTEIRGLAEGLGYLFHALLLHEIGIGSDTLVKAITKSPLGEMRIMPCLSNIQIDLPASNSDIAAKQ